MLPVLIEKSKERLMKIDHFDQLPLPLKAHYIKLHPTYTMRKLQFFHVKEIIKAILDNIDLGTQSVSKRNPKTNNTWYLTEESLAKKANVSTQVCRRVMDLLRSCKYISYKRLKDSKVRVKYLSVSFFIHFFKHSSTFVKSQLKKFNDLFQKVQDKIDGEKKILTLEREKALIKHKKIPTPSFKSNNNIRQIGNILSMLR